MELKYSIQREIDGKPVEIELTEKEMTHIYFYYEAFYDESRVRDELAEEFVIDDFAKYSQVISNIAYQYKKNLGYMNDGENECVAMSEAIEQYAFDIEQLGGRRKDEEEEED